MWGVLFDASLLIDHTEQIVKVLFPAFSRNSNIAGYLGLNGNSISKQSGVNNKLHIWIFILTLRLFLS